MRKKIFLIIPKLIEQPTWGGDYILKLKKWPRKEPFLGLKIGQSYELHSGSWLRADLDNSTDPDFTGMLSRASEPEKTVYSGDRGKLLALKKLIADNPAGVLGKTAAKKYRNKLNLLIKFTQAKDNSFQLHIDQKRKSDRWRPKPESWYYLKPGLVTLGLKPGIDIIKFRKAMLAIESGLNRLSAAVGDGALPLDLAQKKAAAAVSENNPWRFVNRFKVNEGEVIDLSQGGLHHSWEDDPRRFPLGNVVYELQLDVMDPVSTLRCFDKGKFKPDGSLRKLQIDDYFRFLDCRKDYNLPSKHLLKPKKILSNKSVRIESLIANRYYCLDKLTLKSEYAGLHSVTGESFHHLFAQNGSVRIQTNGENLILTTGHSCLITAAAGSYKITPIRPGAEILKSYIG